MNARQREKRDMQIYNAYTHLGLTLEQCGKIFSKEPLTRERIRQIVNKQKNLTNSK